MSDESFKIGPPLVGALPHTITQATIEATMRMMGWEQQRIGTTSRIRLDYEDYCGVCSSPCREYDVALGIPVCCAKCREVAEVTA